jgi:hypothetical protein
MEAVGAIITDAVVGVDDAPPVAAASAIGAEVEGVGTAVGIGKLHAVAAPSISEASASLRVNRCITLTFPPPAPIVIPFTSTGLCALRVFAVTLPP